MARRAETIELAVLGLLHEGPMHGYELRKRLNLMLGWGRVLSYGSLYPTLKKMLRGTLIEEAATTLTPVSRRPRIVYQVTEAGTGEFERLMSEVGPTAWEDDNFGIRFAFFGRTDMEIRLRVLEGRRYPPAGAPRPRPVPAVDDRDRRSTATPPSSSATGSSRPSARSSGSPTSSTPSAAAGHTPRSPQAHQHRTAAPLRRHKLSHDQHHL